MNNYTPSPELIEAISYMGESSYDGEMTAETARVEFPEVYEQLLDVGSAYIRIGSDESFARLHELTLQPDGSVRGYSWDWYHPTPPFVSLLSRGDNPQRRVIPLVEYTQMSNLELLGFEDICWGTEEDCHRAIIDEVQYRRENG